jgi:hypothetical protein
MQWINAVTTDSIPSLRALPAVLPSGELNAEFDDAIEDFDDRRTMGELIDEMDAVTAVRRVIERREDPEEARRLVSHAFMARRVLEPHVVEDYAIVCAMAKIVGEDVTPFLVPAASLDEEVWTKYATRTVLNAWTLWASGKTREALDSVASFRVRQQNAGGPGHEKTRTGAINLMAVYFWAGAIEALTVENRTEALRLWRRALEVAVRHGTNSSLLIQWTYAASFFPY